MTDARLPERLLMDARVNRLPAPAWRSYTHSLMWSVSNRTDGHIAPEDLPLIPMFGHGDEATLVSSGLWIEQGHGWWIDRFDLDQTTRAQLEANERKRAGDRERKARQRERDKCPAPAPAREPGVTRDVRRDVPQEFTGQDRQGKDRQGQAEREVINGGFGDVADGFGASSVPWDPHPDLVSDPWSA